MAIINFSDTKRQAFLRGFQKGLASPVILFGSFQAPRMDAIPQIRCAIYRRPRSVGKRLEGNLY